MLNVEEFWSKENVETIVRIASGARGLVVYKLENIRPCNVKTEKGTWKAFFDLNVGDDELLVSGCRLWEDLDGTLHIYGPGKYEKEIPMDTVKISIDLQAQILQILGV